MPENPAPARPPMSLFRQATQWHMVVNFFLGVSSGLPLLLTLSTLKLWMKTEGVDLKTIGLFSLAGLPYTLKFVWAPLMDRFTPPFWGRRRGWAFITQCLLMISIAAMGTLQPAQTPWLVALFTFFVAFFSASQDIVLDAYRREVLRDDELGLGTGLFITGYRLGMLISGAGAMSLADHVSWGSVYLLMAAMMVIGMVATFAAPNAPQTAVPPRSLTEAVVQPFKEFLVRKGALEILAFILLYKVGDMMASSMTTPFLVDLGFSKTEIGIFGNAFALVTMIIGGLLGGLIILRLSFKRALWIFGILQAVAVLGYSALALIGKNLYALTAVIAFEDVAVGMGATALSAFMAKVCSKRFTATQFALLSSLAGVPRTIISSATGYLAEELGWVGFFIFCTIATIPGLLLILRYNVWDESAG
jgi:PAT family beta-lactamase induction signal transducer AmpG